MQAEAHDALAATSEIVEKALAAGRPALDEAAAKQVLAAYGVPVPAGGLVHSAAEAADLAASLGAPGRDEGGRRAHPAQDRAPARRPRPAHARGGHRDLPPAGGAGRRRPRGGARRGDGGRQPRVHGRHEARRGLRSRGGLRPRRHDDRGVPRHRPRRLPRLRGRCRRAPRSDPGQGAARRRSAASRPSTAPRWSRSSRPSRRSPPTTRRSPRSTSTRCSSVARSRWPPTRSSSFRRLRLRPRRRASSHPTSTPCWRRSPSPSSAPPATSPAGAGRRCKNILAGGFEGAIYPVNPKGGEFFGLPVSTSLDDLPEPPDLALLAVGARQLRSP